MRNFYKNLKNSTSMYIGHKSDSILSRFCLVSLILLTIGAGQAWGAWTGSGQGTLKDGTWYVLYETGEQSIFTTGSKDYTLSGPGKVLTFTAKRSYTAVGNLVVSDNKGTSLYNSNPSTSYTNYTGNNNCNVDATKITFSFTGSYTRYFKNVKVTMAQYVNAPSVTSLDFGSADINTTATSKNVTVAWCNVPAMTYEISGTDKDLFEVSVANNSEAGKYNTATFTVTYKRTTAGSHSATLTISDTYGNYSKTVALSGTTNKLQPTVNWSSNDAIFNVDDELSATNSNGLTVTLSSAGNESYVNCSGNTATMLAATSGKITVTAHVTGNEIYADKDFTKEITITNLEKQHITWTQDLSRLKTTDATKSVVLNATASSGLPVTYELQGDKTGLNLTQSGNTWTLTYSASECKNTTIVAKQGGDATYAAASDVSMPVKVVDPTKVCDENEVLVNSSTTLKQSSVTYNIDIPASMTISLNRVKTGWADIYLYGVDVEFYSGRNGSGTKLYTKSYSASDINNSLSNDNINLSSYINAKSVKVTTNASNGYYLTSLTYTKRKYCTLSVGSLSFETYPNTTTSAKTFNVNYANYPIALECSNNKFSFSPAEFGDCSEYNSQTISVTYSAGADEGDDTGYIYVKDNTGTTLQTCTLTVSISKVDQSITTHNIGTAYKTTDKVTLAAETNSGEADFTYSATPTGVASFEGDVMTFSQSGTIAVTVTEDGSNIYKPCSATVNNVVVSKVTPNIETEPSGTAVTYLQTLSASTISGGRANVTLRGVDDTTVEGSFAWKTPTHQVTDNAGSHSYTVVFTPTDGGMYTTKEFDLPITITRAAQAIAMNNGTVKVAVDGIDANAADSKLDLDNLIASQTTDGNRAGAVTYAVISDNAANASISGSTFSAIVCDTYTVRATKAQTEYYNQVTADFTVTVSKRANTITTAGPYTKYVDDEVTNVATVINSDGEIHTSSSDATIAYYDIANNKIIIPNSEAKSFDQTTITIKIWQDGTARFEGIAEADAKIITLTVKKYDNPFACSWGSWSKTVNFDETTAADFTTNNTDYEHFPIVIEQTSGEKVATLERSDATHNSITASYNIGDATWHLTQAESYKYKAATAKDVTIYVRKLTATECYMFVDNTEHSFETGISDVSGHYDSPIAVSGPVKQLYFDAKKDLLGYDYFIVQYSVDNGTNWRTIVEPDLSAIYETYGPYDFPGLAADERVSHIRFGAKTGGTLWKYYKNIKITRTTYLQAVDELNAEIETLQMDQNTVGSSTTKTFYLDYTTCDETIKLVSSDPTHFTLDQTEITAGGDNFGNLNEVKVTYKSNETGTHSAVITIYTQREHITFTVTGTTDKKHQSIIWADGYTANPLSLPVGLQVDNKNIAATTSSENPVIYTSSDESVVEVIMNGLGFKTVGVGTATLTASEGGNDEWASVEVQKEILVTGKKIQEIVWSQSFIRDLEKDQEITLNAEVYIRNIALNELNLNAEQTGKIVYSCPANNGIISVSGNTMTVLGYGETTITASVAGDEEYEVALPMTQNVIVYEPSQGCPTPYVLDQADNVQLFSYDMDLTNWTTPEITSDPILLNAENGKPDKLSYQHNGELYTVPGATSLIKIQLCRGIVKAQQRIGGVWSDIEGSSFNNGGKEGSEGYYNWRMVRDLQLDENADAIRFVRLTGGQGYHNFKDIQISLKHYVRPTEAVVALGNIEIGEARPVEIGIDYSDVKQDLTAVKGNEADATYTVDENNIHIACGKFGHKNVPVTVTPTKLGAWSNTVDIIDNATNETISVTIEANVVLGISYVFEGNSGENGQVWGLDTNWDENNKPGKTDAVLIKSDVVIVDDVTVGSMTIADGVQVTVAVTGSLTLGSGNSHLMDAYGDLHVLDGGSVTVGSGTFVVRDLILDANLGDAAAMIAGSSGQFSDANEKLYLDRDAYFQMSFDPNGHITYGWYDFTVPFPVNIAGGISRVNSANDKVMVSGKDFIIMEADEQNRANGGKGWRTLNSGTLQPGKLYTITLDDEVDQNTLRFKWNGAGGLANGKTYAAKYATGSATDKSGWNGIGNGMLRHGHLEKNYKMQAYNHTSNTYELVTGNKTFAVGSAFFIQVDAAGDVKWDAAEATKERPLYAPQREVQEVEEFRLGLRKEDTDKAIDVLYFSASEEATEAYVIGHDLLKMGTPAEAKVARMWATKGGKQLCDIEATLLNENASAPLSFFAPKAGEYVLAIEEAPKNANLYLTYNENIIWDLTTSPYTLELGKGATEGYGLRMEVINAPQIATGVDDVQGDNVQSTKARKVLIDNQIYLITPEGAIYDIIGKTIR